MFKNTSTTRVATAVLLVFLVARPASAWGERGHDVVTRVAVRLLAAKIAKGTPLANQWGRREFMLGHVSNVPDIVWRNQGEAIEKVNAPTHFLDIEYVSPDIRFDALPRTTAEGLATMKELCATKPAGYVCPAKPGDSPDESSAGTAPQRVGQFYRLTMEHLKASKASEKTDSNAVDRALLSTGLLSHFIGDLGNPYHAARNYDGWETNQGGVHSYFESAVVASYRLILEQEVFESAQRTAHFDRVLRQIPPAARSTLSRDPIAIAHALALDSYSRLDDANAIDRKFAITKPSGATGPDGRRVAAERRDPSELRFKLHALHVERLATAAETLATLWFYAWEDAGRPDFKDYRSFAYPVSPEFIPPDYLATRP